MDENKVTYFAYTDSRNRRIPFGIKRKDRSRHTYIIGKTGMGKSTLLENMAIQDIQNGEGLAFIDPHGKTADLLLQYIPEHRIRDVLYFAPFDMENPISFNVLEDVGPDKRHLVANGLMSAFKKIWVDAWSARMEYILNNILLALLEYPDSTILGVNRMLADKEYRKKVVENISDPSVKSFWVDEFAKYGERYMQEAGAAIQNKVGQFIANPLVRNIIGQPKSSFDIRKFMDEKKIIIVNLSKGQVGEANANLLGSMLITKIYLAAMSRADLSEADIDKLANFYLYVDEFQSFANESFADILSEARKYRLSLTIAHQYIEQMSEEVRNAVFGNVGTTISFRVGPFDAEVLEKIYAPHFYIQDIVNLGFAQIYLTLMIDGVGSAPFSAMTMPPISRPITSFKDDVIKSSQVHFSKPREQVEQSIKDWHVPIQGGDKKDIHHSERGNTSGDYKSKNSPRGNHSDNVERKSNAPAREFRPTQQAQPTRPDVRPNTVPLNVVVPPREFEKEEGWTGFSEVKNLTTDTQTQKSGNPEVRTPQNVAHHKTEAVSIPQNERAYTQQNPKLVTSHSIDGKKVKSEKNVSALRDALKSFVKLDDKQKDPNLSTSSNKFTDTKDVVEDLPKPPSKVREGTTQPGGDGSRIVSKDLLKKILDIGDGV